MISIPASAVASLLALTVASAPTASASPAPEPTEDAGESEPGGEDAAAPTADQPESEGDEVDGADATPVPAEGEVPRAEDGEGGAGETVAVPEPEPEPEPEPSLEPSPEPEPESEPEGPAAEDDGDGLADGYDPLRDSPEAIRARGWLRSGIVATSVGVGLGVASIILGTLDPCNPAGGNSCFVEARNRAALSAGIPGAVLLAGGVAMTTVGAVRLRRMKATLTPAASLRDGGAVVGLRAGF